MSNKAFNIVLLQISYVPIQDIEFIKQKVPEKTPSESVSVPAKKMRLIPPPLMNMETFYSKLKVANPKAVILSIIPEYSKSFIPVSCTDEFPVNLSTLYKPEYLDLSYNLLLIECEKVFDSLTVTKEQATNLEKETRKQANSKMWFHYRAGRITASELKSAASTDPAQPSQSLIKAVCYPESMKFKSKATW